MGAEMNAFRIRFVALIAIAILGIVSSGCSEKLPERIKPETDPKSRSHARKEITGKKALLVHSYHTGYPWVDTITKGVRAGLAGSGVELKIYYMDTKRRTDEPWKVRAGELAVEEVHKWRPDIIIAADDNAQQYFGRHFVDAEIPLVFCGVNAEPSQYGYPASNITGVIERPFFKETLAFLRQIRNARKVAVLSCDDNTSLGAINFIKEQFADCELETKLVNDFDQWKETIEEYNGRVDALGIYMYHTVKEKGNPVSLDPKYVMQWTVEHGDIPTMGYFEFGVEDGLLLGVVESGEEQGEKAAHYALEILRGVPIDSLPICKANRGKKMLNANTAEHLGIDLPAKLAKEVQIAPDRPAGKQGE